MAMPMHMFAKVLVGTAFFAPLPSHAEGCLPLSSFGRDCQSMVAEKATFSETAFAYVFEVGIRPGNDSPMFNIGLKLDGEIDCPKMTARQMNAVQTGIRQWSLTGPEKNDFIQYNAFLALWNAGHCRFENPSSTLKH